MFRYRYAATFAGLLAAFVVVAGSAPRATALAEDTPPLKLVQKIELSDIHTGEPEVSADQLAKNLISTSRMAVWMPNSIMAC